MSSAAEESSNCSQKSAAGENGAPSSSKAGANYSGAVAQRALFGSYKRRSGGRRMGSNSAPSRLSKVSGSAAPAENS